MTDTETLSENTEYKSPSKPKLEIKGPFPGTPEGVWLTQICMGGRHEGVVDDHYCHGGFNHRGKQVTCRCSCHTIARGLPPGADFDVTYTKRSPTEKTLMEELHEWGRQHDRTNGTVRRKTKIADDEFHEESGRRAKGTLEQQVYSVCADYMTGGFDALAATKAADEDTQRFCDTNLIADEIEFRYGMGRASEGAIRNILIKWLDAGYALVLRKPIAFLIFTPKGSEIIPNKERSK